ncbi:MAG: PilW family protein, partial [Burkholderiaceae bacterium]
MSLIEMMVGLAVGLIVVLAILTTVATVSVQRRTTVSTNDAQESGRAAISQIETSARLAGAGLFFGGSLMCTSLNSFFNAVTSDGGAFLPVEITNGVSDTITFRYENSPGGPDAAPIVANAGPDAATYTVARRGRFQPNDLALIGAPGS